MRVWTWTIALIAAAGLSACATTAPPAKTDKTEATTKAKPLAPGLDPLVHADAFPSTYKPMPSRPTAVVGASVFTGTRTLIENGVVLVKDGRIEAVGPNLPVPAGYETVDGKGKWVTPGLIIGASALGLVETNADPGTNDTRAKGDHNVAAAFRAWEGLNPESVLFSPARNAGQ